MKVLEFMREFALNLYPAFLEDQTVYKAVEFAEINTNKIVNTKSRHFRIKSHFMNKQKMKNDKLFDNSRVD